MRRLRRSITTAGTTALAVTAALSACSSADGQASPQAGPAPTNSAQPNAAPASADADLCSRVVQQLVKANVGVRPTVGSMTWDAGPGYTEFGIEDTLLSVPNPGPQCQPTDGRRPEGSRPGVRRAGQRRVLRGRPHGGPSRTSAGDHSRVEPSNNYLIVATTVTDPASGTVYDVLVKDAMVSGTPEQPNN